jgi:type VII secretion-associated serine protease mycosin
LKLIKLPAALISISIGAGVTLFGTPARADFARDDEWYIRAMNVPAANAISTGKSVTVAVIDTGVYPHDDLRRNLLSGTSFISGRTDNGQVDLNGHGTKMASIIAAHGRANQAGVVGIAPEARILPVSTFNDDGKHVGGDPFAVSKGFEWAVSHGAKIISFSAATAPSSAFRSAVDNAAENDVLIVAAAGNAGEDVVSAYPANYPGVLAVGASDKSGQHASISYRAPYIQICAPGVDIEGAKPPNGYQIGDGTSSATAIVSGAAALIRAKYPDISAQEVIHRITATATDIGKPGRDDECGFGVLNLVKALTANIPPLHETTTTAPSTSPTTPTATTPTNATAAPPTTEPAGSNTPAIVGGIVFGLVVFGLIVFAVVRRRKQAS